jgi:precorrin-6A/cobalt-precorrin-6A reductase
MIFFMAGTSDAKLLALQIQLAGYPLLASVVTEHAAQELAKAGIEARFGRLCKDEMVQLLGHVHAQMIVDASHPFAEEAHRTAMAAARERGIAYVRYERAHQSFADHPLLTLVDTYDEAAELALARKGSVMLTTGSKTLQIFTSKLLGQADLRLVCRMLPRQDNMEKSAELGMSQKDIIAMQGPFSKALNQALYQHYETTLMITKESGCPGAVDEKVTAALDMGIEVVIIGRPNMENTVFTQLVFSQMEDVLTEIAQISNYPAGGRPR